MIPVFFGILVAQPVTCRGPASNIACNGKLSCLDSPLIRIRRREDDVRCLRVSQGFRPSVANELISPRGSSRWAGRCVIIGNESVSPGKQTMQAFEGYRVLDLTHVLAGPFCTYQLAVLGADVIKIESPTELDLVRHLGVDASLNAAAMSTLFQTQSANKRSLTVNLKTQNGREIFKRLLKTADVVVENYRCGALEALGLGVDVMHEVNERLVICSITGYGQTGPKRSHTAFDNVIQAFSGLMAVTGTEDSGPIKVGAPVLDYGTGAQAAFAIAAALLRRERCGEGQHLDVSMLDAAMVLMSSTVLSTQIIGSAPKPSGNSHPDVYGYGCYATASGQLMLGLHTPRQYVRMWRVLGEDGLAEEMAGLDFEQIEHRYGQHKHVLSERLLTRDASEWEDLLNAVSVPAARVRTLHEAIGEEQLSGRAVLQTVDGLHGAARGARIAVSATSWSAQGPELNSPPPEIGQHNDAVLTELGYSSNEIQQLRADSII